MRTIEDQISANKRDSIILVGVVSAALVVLFYLFAQIYDPSLVFLFLIIAVILSTLGTITSYWYSDKIVLSVTKTREPTPLEQAHLSNVVEGLAIAAGIPAPHFIIIKDDTNLNAFATGRDPNHAVLAVTSALLNVMNREELEGVIAHEMSHIENYDIRFASMVAVLVGIVVIASQIFLRSMWFSGGSRDRKGGNVIFLLIGIVLAILAPIFTQLIQLAVSRQREYLADSSGAYLTRNPMGLASALEKIKDYNVDTKVNGAVAHLYFTNPSIFKNANSWFATHPPIDERIKRLKEM
ncbi:MAG: M48 family metallopeptidase [Bacteroidota bacterium]|nr:M48 family metallopeptidase [Bacteroidota bacterium]